MTSLVFIRKLKCMLNYSLNLNRLQANWKTTKTCPGQLRRLERVLAILKLCNDRNIEQLKHPFTNNALNMYEIYSDSSHHPIVGDLTFRAGLCTDHLLYGAKHQTKSGSQNIKKIFMLKAKNDHLIMIAYVPNLPRKKLCFIRIALESITFC